MVPGLDEDRVQCSACSKVGVSWSGRPVEQVVCFLGPKRGAGGYASASWGCGAGCGAPEVDIGPFGPRPKGPGGAPKLDTGI